MAESIDRVTSNLLCSENSNTCFNDLECNDEDVSGISHQNLNFNNGYPGSDNRGSDSLMSFLVQSEEKVRVMVEREREHLPKDDYLKRLRSGDLGFSVRREALDWIWKVGLICFSSWVVDFARFIDNS